MKVFIRKALSFITAGLTAISVMSFDGVKLDISAGAENIEAECEHINDADGGGYCDDCKKMTGSGAFAGATVTLGGELGVNFFAELADEAKAATTYVKFTVNGEETIVNYSDSAASGNYHVFTCNVAAKKMSDNIAAELYIDDTKAAVASTSVKAYANKILADTENAVYTASQQDIAKAMLNYGAYAQIYFGYNTDALANEGYENTELTVGDLSEYGKAVRGSVTGISYFGTTSVFESNTAIRHYFTLSSGQDIGNFTFTCGGKELTPVTSGSRYYVEIKDIASTNLKNQYVLSVTDGTESMNITYGVYSYINSIVTKSGYSADMVNLAKALYLYGEASNTASN